jgi:hypothetical protein
VSLVCLLFLAATLLPKPARCYFLVDNSEDFVFKRSECFNEYYTSLPTLDPAACGTLKGEENARCYRRIALLTNDTRYCEDISDRADWTLCFTTVAGNLKNASLCKSAEPSVTDQCLLEVAPRTNDATLCGQITTSVWKNKCFSEVATNTHNDLLCLNISSPLEKDDCYISLAYTYDDISDCEMLTNPTTNYLGYHQTIKEYCVSLVRKRFIN